MKKIIFAAAMVAMMCASNVAFAQVKKVAPVKTGQTASKKAEAKTMKKSAVKAEEATKAECKTMKKSAVKAAKATKAETKTAKKASVK